MSFKAFCENIPEMPTSIAPPTAGIYVILNTLTMRAYIGKATNLRIRFVQHRRMLGRGLHHNARLQADWLAYGESAFRFCVFSEMAAADIYHAEETLISEALGDDCYNWAAKGSLGRPPLDEAARLQQKTIRLKPSQWAKVDEYGIPWLRKLIEKAKPPKPE